MSGEDAPGGGNSGVQRPGPQLTGQSQGRPEGPTGGQGGRGRGVRAPPAGLTDTAGSAAFTLREMQASGQLSAGRPFQAESDVTSRLRGLGHRMRRELPAWGATLEMLRQAGVPRRNPGERGRPAAAATEQVRRDCFWMCFESKDKQEDYLLLLRLIQGESGFQGPGPQVNSFA